MTYTIFTGSIARSTTRQYVIYSEADFEVFRPAGAKRCSDWGQIWRGGGDLGMEEGWSPPPRQTSPQSVQRLGYRTPKLKFFTKI